MTDNQKLNELLLQVSLSNQKAFTQLYKLSSAKLFAISIRIIKEQSLAEDILQESFMQIWNKAASFDVQKAQAITWMGTIVRNKSIDLIRKRVKENNCIDLEEELIDVKDEVNNPENLAIAKGMLNDVNKCMTTFKSDYRSVILLSYLEGYSHQQIANKIEKPIGTIKSWISRGTEELKKCLRGKYEL